MFYSDRSNGAISILSLYDWFGTHALFFNLPNSATVEAIGRVKCLKIHEGLFKETIIPVINKLKNAAEKYQLFIEKQA